MIVSSLWPLWPLLPFLPHRLMSTETSRRPRSRLHPVILATGFVSLFTDLGSEMVYPLIPFLLTMQLGASRTLLGLMEGLGEGMPNLVKLFSGAISDRVRNRPRLIFAGYALSTFAKPLIGLARSAGGAIGFRAVDRIGKGVRGAPRDAIVADYAEADQRGRAFGYQRAMDHFGAVGGGLACFLLFQVMGFGIRNIFLISIIPGLFALMTILFFIREKPGRTVRSEKAAVIGSSPLQSRAFSLFLGASTLFAFANSSDAFLLLRARDLGVPIGHIPLVWSALHVVKALSNWWGGGLADRLGKRSLLAGGWLLYAGVYFLFAQGTGPNVIWGLFLLYGLFFGLTEGTAKAFVADLVPSESRGKAFGILGFCEGTGLILASLLTGFLWDTWGPSPAFLFAATSSLAAAILILKVCTRPVGPPNTTL